MIKTSSEGGKRDEIDFEFLGNVAGQPYTIHTNMFVAGMGNREVQFKPWFNPAEGFHNYTITWTPCMVVWYVDSIPIRLYTNSHGVAFPNSQPMGQMHAVQEKYMVYNYCHDSKRFDGQTPSECRQYWHRPSDCH